MALPGPNVPCLAPTALAHKLLFVFVFVFSSLHSEQPWVDSHIAISPLLCYVGAGTGLRRAPHTWGFWARVPGI